MKQLKYFQPAPMVFGAGQLQTYVYVIMPLLEIWSEAVWNTIRATMLELGYACVRADEQRGQNVMEDIRRGLSSAALVIADVTGRNCNVYFELGFADALHRRIILLTQDPADVVFIAKEYRYILYSAPSQPRALRREMHKLAAELRSTVEWIRANEKLPPAA